ncbi:hypothetical protein ACMD2_01677, partial [Ananas comosus]
YERTKGDRESISVPGGGGGAGIVLRGVQLRGVVRADHAEEGREQRRADDDGRISWFTGDRELAAAAGKRPFHVAMTAMADPYSRWQSRIMYKRAKAAGAGAEEMGGFTRVLHSGEADDLMGEIPTVVVNPLPPGADRTMGLCTMAGKSRDSGRVIDFLPDQDNNYRYILMAEPDHIFVKPLPNLVREDRPVAYPFFYIRPAKQEKILRKYYPEEKGPVTNIDPIGNSPVIIKKSALTKIAPTWMNMSLEMKMDNKTDKAFGWVLEMYAYAVASALHGVHHILYKDFMIQPPWDLSVGETFIIHYTYGCDYSLKGELTYGKIGEWRFDKRSYLKGPLPRNLSLPPPGVPESVVTLVKMVNEATANIPGWDDDDDDDNSEL